MWSDVDGDQSIACPSARTRPALPFQPDLLATRNACRDFDLDVLAGRQMDASLRAICSVVERDGERRVQILPSAGAGTDILAFERRAPLPRTPRSRAAKHATQKFIDPAAEPSAASTARAPEAVGTETETLEMRATTRIKTAARLRTETFEALETRLAFRVDLTTIKCLALVGIAHDLIGGVKFGETRGRLRIVLVGIRMQFFREPAIGAFDIAFARNL